MIRNTLSVLDRFKFFFNLPSSLEDLIKKHKFDLAVRDYRKGRAMMHSALQRTSGSSTSPPSFTVDQYASLQRPSNLQTVFDRVWTEVEQIVVTLRAELFKDLSDMTLSIDVHERNIGYLLDVETVEDPLWFLIDCQHKWTLQQLSHGHQAFFKKVDGNNNSSHIFHVPIFSLLLEVVDCGGCASLTPPPTLSHTHIHNRTGLMM